MPEERICCHYTAFIIMVVVGLLSIYRFVNIVINARALPHNTHIYGGGVLFHYAIIIIAIASIAYYYWSFIIYYLHNSWCFFMTLLSCQYNVN